ncbi:MAG: [Fe-Fe] hydrogenase large subunit C-terminal domain-containing protein [Christensenellales bacterium]
MTDNKQNEKSNNIDQTKEVLDHLAKKDKRMIVAFAPSARVSIGEMFGGEVGQNVERKIVSALKLLGFDDIFDIDFGADLTIMEEAEEFAQFMQKKWTSNDEKVKNSTFFTSCCPAWVKFVQKVFPQFKNNISSCKSPQEMTSTIAKTYYARKLNLKPSDIYFVSIMPCVAKKFERLTDSFVDENGNKKYYTDAVLTVREVGEILKAKGINLLRLEDGQFDLPLGISSGAGVIFGTAGGVMESALRTLEDKFSPQKSTNKDKKSQIKSMDFLLKKGKNGIKEGTALIAGKEVKIAVASGLAGSGQLLRDISSGKKSYDFVEVMACAGGCVNGTGMPLCTATPEQKEKIITKRAQGLRRSDGKKSVRKSHENPAIIDLYTNFLGKAGSPLAHELLHISHNTK